MIWQVAHAQKVKTIPPFDATLEYLGNYGSSSPTGRYPGAGEYLGEGIFTVDTYSGPVAGRTVINTFCFHLHYTGPEIAWPASSYIAIDLEQLGGYLDRVYDDGTPIDGYHGFFISQDGNPPAGGYGRTYNTLIDNNNNFGSNFSNGEWCYLYPGYHQPYENIGLHFERRKFGMGWTRQFPSPSDWWFCPSFRYSLCTAKATFRMHSISIVSSWPTSGIEHVLWRSKPYPLPPVEIYASTNTTPIAMSTKTDHYFKTGDLVVIRDHLLNTAANGVWRVTVQGPRNFTLDDTTGIAVGGETGTAEIKGTII